jgi:hypothetical protein
MEIKKVGQVKTSRMQGMWEDALENCTWNVSVSYLANILNLTFYSPCYQRIFEKKKVEIELSSGDENDVLDVKPKLEEMEPCCSSFLKD